MAKKGVKGVALWEKHMTNLKTHRMPPLLHHLPLDSKTPEEGMHRIVIAIHQFQQTPTYQRIPYDTIYIPKPSSTHN